MAKKKATKKVSKHVAEARAAERKATAAQKRWKRTSSPGAVRREVESKQRAKKLPIK